jgi:spermidine synthase
MNIFAGIQSPKVVYEADSKYNGHIKVIEYGQTIKIRVDNTDQSLNPDSPACKKLYWGKVVELLQLHQPNLKRILILGFGGGTIAHLVSRTFPQAEIYGVEIDPVMIDIANQYFHLGDIHNLHVLIEDALRVVVEPDVHGLREEMFDTILVDIYVGEKYPDLGKSGNFVTAVKRLLLPGGLIIFNRIYREEHQDEVNTFVDYIENILSNVKCTVVAGYTNSDNILIYGRS